MTSRALRVTMCFFVNDSLALRAAFVSRRRLLAREPSRADVAATTPCFGPFVDTIWTGERGAGARSRSRASVAPREWGMK